MIRFENVSKSYGSQLVLDNLNLEIGAGEFAVLIGPSGCGKTTTLKSINRLIEPDKGSIYIDGKDISQTDPVQLRRSIGYVIQQIGLFPNMTVAQNIAVVPKRLKYSREEIDRITRELLAIVGMDYDEYAGKYPSELSGGQQQRIGVLRALAASPPIVLMDEPFGALDPVTRGILQEEIVSIQKKLHKTIVFVTHDMDEALKLADTIIFMDKGKIVQKASPEEMLEHPASDLIRSFMGQRVNGGEMPEMTAGDFTRKGVVTVYKSRGVRECAELMARHKIDSLVVKQDDDTYAGVVTIANLRRHSEAKTIGDIPLYSYDTTYLDENAVDCFDRLIGSGDNYVVALNRDNTIAGIVTKTSMARAMADRLWGEG